MDGSPHGEALSRRPLLALFAPGSAEAEVCRLQDALFSRHALVSAISLVPLIPILFLPEEAEEARLRTLGKTLPPLRPFAVTAQRWEGGGLFLGVDTGGAWAALRDEARALFDPGELPAPLFAPAEGFCLGCWEAPPEMRETLSVGAPALRFTSCTLALACISAREDGPWWREVYLETLWERPLRRGSRSPGQPRNPAR